MAVDWEMRAMDKPDETGAAPESTKVDELVAQILRLSALEYFEVQERVQRALQRVCWD